MRMKEQLRCLVPAALANFIAPLGRHRVGSGYVAFLTLLTLLCSVATQPSLAQTSDATEPTQIEFMSDQGFAKALEKNEGIVLPIFLGCNKRPHEPKLPVKCEFGGLNLMVKEISADGASLGELVRRVPISDRWIRVLTSENDVSSSLRAFQWAEKVVEVWRYDKNRLSVLCGIGRASLSSANENSGRIHLVARCYLVFEDAYLRERDRAFVVDLEDSGEFSLFGNRTPTDEEMVKAYLTFFVLQVYSFT